MIFPSPSSPLLSSPFFGWTLNCLHLHQLLRTLYLAQFFVFSIRKFSPCVVKNLLLIELTSSFLLFLLPVNRSRQSVRLCSYVKPSDIACVRGITPSLTSKGTHWSRSIMSLEIFVSEKRTHLCWDNKAPASWAFFTASTSFGCMHDRSIYLFIYYNVIH